MGTRVVHTDGVTIVGGRPMHRAVAAEQLPQGVEQVLTVAALDHRFREQVEHDPVKAAGQRGIELDAEESTLLRSVQPSQLAAMARRVVIPPGVGRREFVKGVSASIVALVTGKAMLLCSGCTGMDSSWEDPDGGDGANQQWMNLAGHTCYVYLPVGVGDASTPAPLLVALHGDDENCLSSVQRWHGAADRYRFALLAINWTEEAPTPGTWDQLVADLPDIVAALETYYQTASDARYLTSRGASTAIAWKAAYQDPLVAFAATAWLGGVPEGDWVGDATALASEATALPALYYVMGREDDEYAAASACYDAVTARGAPGLRSEVAGRTDSAVLDLSSIWEWMNQHRA